jgi:hypothetical protein
VACVEFACARIKKRKNLIAQGINLNLDSAASYFNVPSGFLRQF